MCMACGVRFLTEIAATLISLLLVQYVAKLVSATYTERQKCGLNKKFKIISLFCFTLT